MVSNIKIGIIGYGVVGKAQTKFYGKSNCIIHDPPLGHKNRALINKVCDLVYICVPTSMKKDKSCDISIVEESIKWLDVPLVVIRSTILPGTCEYLTKKYSKEIVFQPEYLGETPLHPYINTKEREFIILGGPRPYTEVVISYMQQVMHPKTHFHQTDWRTAELVKYMENCWLGTKVTFCNEFYDIAKELEIDYNELRELWLTDKRVNRSHTFVYPNKRGFGGKCLPKDINAIVKEMENLGHEPKLMKNILERNKEFKNENK